MGKGKNSEQGPFFYILDGHSLAYRAFFALPLELKTKEGLHTNAILGFINMLLRLMKDRGPEYMAAAFDHPTPTFRHEKYEEYKATREKTPPEMSEQVPLIKQILQAMKIPVVEMPGYEADDVIGSFAKKGEKKGFIPVIVTADADAFQLLSEQTRVLITRKGLSQLEEMGPEAFRREYGLEPHQWVDFKALQGDASDNVPGVPGIGKKRALSLLQQYRSLDRLLEEKDRIGGKMGENISAAAAQALLSRELVTICDSLELPFEVEQCRVKKPDWQFLYDLFQSLEFKSLIDKVPELSTLKERQEERSAPRKPASESVQGSLFDPADSERLSGEGKMAADRGEGREIDMPQEADRLEKQLKEDPLFSLLINWDRSDVPGAPSGMALAFQDGNSYYISAEQGALFQRISSALYRAITDRDREVVVHDLKPFLKYCLRGDMKPAASFFDTLLAAYLLDPDRNEYHLPSLMGEYTGFDDYSSLDEECYFGRLAADIFALRDVFAEKIKERDMENLFRNLEVPLAGVLARMELRGIKVRTDILAELKNIMAEKIDRLEKEIHEMAGEAFNLNSPKQLSYILFEKLGLPVIRKIKTGYSTDARVLQELSAIHPIASKLLEYRMVTKIMYTYLEGLRQLVDARTGKIHTTFNQTVTSTGRLSSKDPNLQNIPIRLEEGRQLRKAFTPSREENLLLAADYSQIELRIMAHLSRDPNLVDAFRKAQDVHTRTAAEVFGVPPEEVTPSMRSRAKAINFGIIYGMSDYGLSQDLGIPRGEARSYIEEYFRRYTGVADYVKRCVEEARRRGYVTTLMNRFRSIPDINHSNHTRRSFAERIARNTPIQGSAADIIKAAMVFIERQMEHEGRSAMMLLQVHDELIFELPAEELQEVASMVKGIMENVYPLSVPLTVELKAGRDWYHLSPLEGREQRDA